MKQPELGAYITSLRNKKGFTQKELAEQCNVDIRTIQRIENGDVVPRMYTVNLLSKALDVEINITADVGMVVDEKYIQRMRFSWIWGIIFSVNYFDVVYNIITHSFNSYNKIGIIINIVGFIFFFNGFYHIGKKYNNLLLSISVLSSMVLVTYINLIYFLPVLSIYYMQAYVLMCAAAVFTAIGVFLQGNKVAYTGHFNLYKIAGIIGVVQSRSLPVFSGR